MVSDLSDKIHTPKIGKNPIEEVTLDGARNSSVFKCLTGQEIVWLR